MPPTNFVTIFVTNIDVAMILLKYLFSFLNFFLMISEIDFFLTFNFRQVRISNIFMSKWFRSGDIKNEKGNVPELYLQFVDFNQFKN